MGVLILTCTIRLMSCWTMTYFNYSHASLMFDLEGDSDNLYPVQLRTIQYARAYTYLISSMANFPFLVGFISPIWIRGKQPEVRNAKLEKLSATSFGFYWIENLTFSLPFPLTETISPVFSMVPFLVIVVQLTRTSPPLLM